MIDLNLKLCKDCKWIQMQYKAIFGFFSVLVPVESFPRCMHDEAIDSVDLVNGKIHRNSCNNMREYEKCGKDAKFFESRNV